MAVCLMVGVVVLSVAPLWLLVHYSKTHADEAFKPGRGEAWPTWRMMFWDFFLDDDEFARRVEHEERDRDNTI